MKKLFNHQNDILSLLATHKQFAIFAEQGTGKTYPVLLHITGLLRSGKIKNALVIAPKSALGSWKVDGEDLPVTRRKQMDKITFINYESVWRRKETDQYFDLVVCDESHRIAHRSSKQTKFILKYNQRSEYRYIMTGTPMGQGRLEDYWAQFEFLNHNYLGTYKEFEARYLKLFRLPNSYVDIVTGYRNKEELLARVGALSYCVRKRDCLDLPEKMPDQLVIVENKEKRLCKEITEGYIGFLDEALDNALVVGSKLRQVATGFVYDSMHNVHRLKCEKMNVLNELLDSILPEKVVIFANFTDSIDRVVDTVERKDVRYLVLDGRTKDKECWKEFQTDDSIKVMICQFSSGNAGINLQSSSHMIFIEPPIETIVAEQARDRIHRTGQKNACNYYWLVTEGSIEIDIYKNLVKKQDFTNDCMKRFVEQRRGNGKNSLGHSEN